jgi:nucleotide-binding universal stress UspA family protein
MYNHLLIATDGSELATKALKHGLALAKREGAEVTVVTVTEPWSPLEMAQKAREHRPNPVAEFEAIAAEAADRILGAAAEHASELGVRCECLHVSDQHPAEGIINTAKAKGSDLIVMGSHGRRGFSRVLLGSQSYEVLTLCTVPALVVR